MFATATWHRLALAAGRSCQLWGTGRGVTLVVSRSGCVASQTVPVQVPVPRPLAVEGVSRQLSVIHHNSVLAAAGSPTSAAAALVPGAGLVFSALHDRGEAGAAEWPRPIVLELPASLRVSECRYR